MSADILPPAPPPDLAAAILAQLLPPAALADAAGAATGWLWRGYLAPGKITLLTSQWKTGKTTLTSVLLARLLTGGTLAGLEVTPAPAVVVSEEGPAEWDRRCQQLGIRDGHAFLCRPFKGKPTPAEWRGLIDALTTARHRDGVGLVVIDTLASFLPGNVENSAGPLLDCLAPLHQLTQAGLGVLLNHHPRKGKALAGQASRGSGALLGFADILVEMGWYARPDEPDRRRRLRADSRDPDTPRRLLIELTADGTDYVAAAEQEPGLEEWPELEEVLTTAVHKLTREQILEGWPHGRKKPNPTTLWRWLETATARGVLHREGSGKAGEPLRYWVPEREPLLQPIVETQAEIDRRLLLKVLKGELPEA